MKIGRTHTKKIVGFSIVFLIFPNFHLCFHNSIDQMLKIIGPLQDPVTWYKITYTGEQVAQQDFKKKGRYIVLEVPLCNLLTSICNFVLCDWVLQRAYFSFKRLYFKNGTEKFFYYRILISRIRCNFWQSLKQFCTWGWEPPYILKFIVPFLKYKRLKLKSRVFLAGHSVAMITYCVTKIYQRVYQWLGSFLIPWL